jgi:hypothetical protein
MSTRRSGWLPGTRSAQPDLDTGELPLGRPNARRAGAVIYLGRHAVASAALGAHQRRLLLVV